MPARTGPISAIDFVVGAGIGLPSPYRRDPPKIRVKTIPPA